MRRPSVHNIAKFILFCAKFGDLDSTLHKKRVRVKKAGFLSDPARAGGACGWRVRTINAYAMRVAVGRSAIPESAAPIWIRSGDVSATNRNRMYFAFCGLFMFRGQEMLSILVARMIVN